MAPTSRDTPESITIGDKKISLKGLKNPLPSSPETTQEGGEIYIKNCLLCHGDLLDGKGIFGESFFPAPANFTQKILLFLKLRLIHSGELLKVGKDYPKNSLLGTPQCLHGKEL